MITFLFSVPVFADDIDEGTSTSNISYQCICGATFDTLEDWQQHSVMAGSSYTAYSCSCGEQFDALEEMETHVINAEGFNNTDEMYEAFQNGEIEFHSPQISSGIINHSTYTEVENDINVSLCDDIYESNDEFEFNLSDDSLLLDADLNIIDVGLSDEDIMILMDAPEQKIEIQGGSYTQRNIVNAWLQRFPRHAREQMSSHGLRIEIYDELPTIYEGRPVSPNALAFTTTYANGGCAVVLSSELDKCIPHELAHVYDYQSGKLFGNSERLVNIYNLERTRMNSLGWLAGDIDKIHIDWYHSEYYADAVRLYYTQGSDLQLYCPYTYEFVEASLNNTKNDFWYHDLTEDVIKIGANWYFVKGGNIIQHNYTGFKSNVNGLWRIVNGRVDFEASGLISGYYVSGGKVQMGYTGFAKGGATWYRIVNGRINNNANDVINGTINGESAWWFVKDGKVQFINTVGTNSHGTWIIINGKVDFSQNGVIKAGDGNWYYVVDGKIQTDYTGIKNNSNGWWRIVNGKVDFYANGIYQNEYGWWKVENGKVNFGFNGFANNSNGWWYLEEGKVQFEKNDVIHGTINGTDGWWHVVGGKVTFDTCFAHNSNGWWRISNGRVDFNVNDIIYGNVSGTYAWWYVVDGKVTFNNVPTVARNDNGWWYVHYGYVDFEFTGIAHNSNGYWYCKNGKVQFGYTGWIYYKGDAWYVREGKATQMG